MEKTPSSKVTLAQVLWAAAGTGLLAASLLAYFVGTDDLSSIAVPLGIFMFFAGSVNIIIYEWHHKSLHGSHWLLADGMSTVLLSFFLLFNQMIQDALIPFFFGFWELFSGVLKFIDSKDLREEHIRGWHLFACVGTVEIISGVAALLKPVDDYVGMHQVVAIVILIQALGFLFKILVYPHLLCSDDKNKH